ncbi:hypothetical protein GCM10022245_30190 [Streptomyces mayteni]
MGRLHRTHPRALPAGRHPRRRTGELIIKVVNAQDEAAVTAVDLGRGTRVGRTAQVTTLTGDPDAVNGETDQPIEPVKCTFRGVDNRFTYTFPPHSVTFLRVPLR